MSAIIAELKPKIHPDSKWDFKARVRAAALARFKQVFAECPSYAAVLPAALELGLYDSALPGRARHLLKTAVAQNTNKWRVAGAALRGGPRPAAGAARVRDERAV